MDNIARKPGNADREVGERIRTLRQLKGMTQTELATELGVSFQQVQKYERGANRLPIGMFIGACKALQAHPMELIGPYFPDDNVFDSMQALMTKLRDAEDRLHKIKQVLE